MDTTRTEQVKTKQPNLWRVVEALCNSRTSTMFSVLFAKVIVDQTDNLN